MNTQAYRRKLGLTAFLASIIAGGLVATPLAAAEVSHGEMAAAIRSASFPCAHVRKVDPTGDNAWVVECNSGTFRVSRDQDGRFNVTQATEN